MKNNDYKIVLIYLAKLFEGQSNPKPVSLLFLSKQMGINQDVLGNTIELLGQDGYVNVQHPNSKTILVSPTIKGMEKAVSLNIERESKSLKGRFFSAGKYVAGSLIVVILGVVWWWLGLSNQGKEPLISTVVPFKVYNQWTSSLISKRGGGPFYEAKNITLRDGETPNPDGTITATLNGRFVLRFQIESNALNHQINIQSIEVQIERDSPPDVTDVFQGLVGLGGGGNSGF